MRGLLVIGLLARTGVLGAQTTASLVERGFDHFYNLEYPEAIADFEQATQRDANDPELHNHVAQALLFREMYRDGALESELVSGNNSFLRRPKMNPEPETERRFLDEVTKAISLSEGRLSRNDKDTGAMYSLGISYGLRSNYFWLVRKSWRDSLRDATTARKWHNRVSELSPADVDARLVQGLHDYIVGSLPWKYRMMGVLVGIRGDKEKGIATIQEVARKGNRNRVDAEFFLGALYRREGQPKIAIPLVQELIGRFPRNYLLRMELSQMYSMAWDGPRALEAVAEVARLKSQHAPGYDRVPWEKIWFQQGTIQFWFREPQKALENMKKVAAGAEELDLNTASYAFLRVGQLYDLDGRRNDALDWYRKGIAYAPQAEGSQEARKYLSAPYRR
jgi:tetratricopeptide (TPR) repeat protein